jgi:hypothetical protein
MHLDMMLVWNYFPQNFSLSKSKKSFKFRQNSYKSFFIMESDYIKIDGNGNIILQDVNGRDIKINDVAEIKKIFETSEPEYLQKLYEEIDKIYTQVKDENKKLLEIIIFYLEKFSKERNIPLDKAKNFVTGSFQNINEIHIGDKIYYPSPPPSERKKSSSLLKPAVIFVSIIVIFSFFLFYPKNIPLLKPASQDTAIKKQNITADTQVQTQTNQVSIIQQNTSQSGNNLIPSSSSQKEELPNETNDFELSVWLSDEDHIIYEGETYKIFYKATQPCYLRILYENAQGNTKILLDNYQVSEFEINDTQEIPENFICTPPFGKEKIIIIAQKTPFDTERGLKPVNNNAIVKTIDIITKPKN